MRLAAVRFLADHARAGKPGCPFRFDRRHAEDACGFIEQLPHVEGTWEEPTLKLHPSHVFFVVNLFGFRQADGEDRRFSVALMAVARKNAKSTLAAGILLYCQCCENEVGAQLITAATTGQQARVVFNIAKRMVEQTPDLRAAFGLEPFANAVAGWKNGSSLKPINAKASTQDGLNPSHTALDEVHAHKTHDLLNVLQSAAGARANPLWLYTTTEGYETPGPWPELRHFCHQVLEGVVEADHFFGVIYALDEKEPDVDGVPGRPEDSEFDERNWVKANPLIEVNPVLVRELRKAAIDARHMPSRHAEFKIKRMNRQAAAANSWVDLIRWKACSGPVDLDALRGKPCVGALDLSSTTDLCSFRLTWLVDGTYFTWGMRWVPESAVAQRNERGTVKYGPWIEAGHVRQTEGNVVDYEVIEREVLALCLEHTPREVAYDRWNAVDISNRLAKKLPTRTLETGETVSIMTEFRQGTKSYHPAMQELERVYLSLKLAHGGDPVLAWCASNLVARKDENLNMAPDRKRSADKIDDMVTLLMGVGRLMVQEEEPSYQMMIL